jgi:two-component system OmpR family sensor kinase
LFNKDSIIWKINFIFLISFITLFFAVLMAQIYISKEDKSKTAREIHKDIDDIWSFQELNEIEKKPILKYGTLFNIKDFKPHRKDFFDEHKHHHHEKHHQDKFDFGKIEIIKYENQIYYLLHHRGIRVFESKIELQQRFFPIYTGFSLLLFLSIFYYTILKSLKPLKKLEESIRDFGDGNLNLKIDIKANDEVGRIADEFSKAVQKIGELERSRELFLRNIIHELKTPITKGKLALALFKDEKGSEILNRAFNRLDSLINEMANVEKLTSQKEICLSPHRLSTILEESIKLGFLQKEKIEISEYKDDIFDVDLNLFSIAFKNLLDNGIKYSTDKKVKFSFENGNFTFYSTGKKLEKDLSSYVQPFNHSQITSKRGFGLGLYITNEILQRHNFQLKYSYKDGENIFYF